MKDLATKNPEERKRCSRCKLDIPRRMFGENPSWCRKCRNDHAKDRVVNDAAFREKQNAKARAYMWLRKYGIPTSTFNAFLAAQGGVCAICKMPEGVLSNRKHHVDHCHTTGKLRGLLCSGCNTALGMLKEDPAVMANMIEYVNRHKNFGQND